MKRRHLITLTIVCAGLVTGLTLLLRIFVSFARPQALWLGALVVLTALLWGGYQLWRRNLAGLLGERQAVEKMASSWSARAAVGRIALLLFAMQCFVFVAAQPQWGEATRRVERQGIDVVLAMDASRSMLAEDVPPSRLEAAASEVNSLLERLSGDRVGLVVFAGFAFTQSPLTSDYGAIRLYIDRLNPASIPAQGTAIGRAIRESTELLTGGGDEGFRRSNNQLIIVISDGEDHETEPVEAAAAAAEAGIRVYTVGLGTESGGRIPVRDRAGNLTGWFTDRRGEVVVTRLADAQLREVARAGNGDYQRYAGPGSVARFVEDAIEDFEEEELSSALRTHYVDRPEFFVIPGLLALLAHLMLVERTRRSLASVLLVAAMLTGCQPIEHRDPNVRRAAEASNEGNHDEALAEIEGAGATARENPAFFYNRGLIYERLSNAEEAAEDYLNALGASEDETRLRSLVGLGNSLFMQEDYEGARERYERALREDPERDNARRNLEIALRRLFPPCYALDDELEDNDAVEEAATLPLAAWVGPNAAFNRQRYAGQDSPPRGAAPEEPEPVDLVSCGLDADWYALPLEPGGRLSVRVDFRRLRDDTGGPPPPDEVNASALSLALVDADGEIFAVDQGMDDESLQIDARRVEREISELLITEEMPEELFVLIETSAGLEYDYDLEVEFTPPCRALDDAFEDNDTPQSAWPLENGQHEARVCVDDEDWYSVTLSDGADLFVDVWPSQLDETRFLPLEISEASPATEDPAFSSLDPQQRVASFSARDVYEPTSYRYAVRAGSEQEGPYQIDAWIYPPCPVGNDRFEPNNSPPDQVTLLEARQNELRHLRLCEADEDWFVMQLPPPEEPEEEGAPVAETQPFAALVEYETPDRTVLVELYDTATGEKLADAIPLDESDYDTEYSGAVVALANLPRETSSVGVRVYGDPGYFHLRFPETQPPPEQQEQESQSGEGDEDEEEQNDEPPPEEGDENEAEADQNEEEQDADEEQEPQDGEQQAQQPSGEPSEEESERRLRELLNSLEDEELNLQLQQAIDDLPPNRMTNEW